MPHTTTHYRVDWNAPEADIQTYFAGESIWNCYAVANLTPMLRPFSRYALAYVGNDIQAGILNMELTAFPLVAPFGVREGIAAILAAGNRPQRALLQAQDHDLDVFRPYYTFDTTDRAMYRMIATSATFAPSRHAMAPLAQRLGPEDAEDLQELYANYAHSLFRPETLVTGCYYGMRENGRLIAAGGTHVLAPDYGIGVLGSIFTEPEARGKGYGSQITAALTADLLQQGCQHVVLNVFASNTPAIRVYERLGFRTHGVFWNVHIMAICPQPGAIV